MKNVASLLLLSLSLLHPSGAAAQQAFTFGDGKTDKTVPAARDFAATSIGDPWDFNNPADHALVYAADFDPKPQVTGGRLTGRVRPPAPCSFPSGATLADCAFPQVQLQFEGFLGALNDGTRNGLTFPIDSTYYNRLSFRLRRSVVPSTYDLIQAGWFHELIKSSGTGTRLGLSRGYDDVLKRFVNQSPPATQAAATYHVFKFDLDPPVNAARQAGVAWNARPIVRGLTLTLGEGVAALGSLAGATIDLDWVRLTHRDAVTVDLKWGTLGGRVTLTASNGTDIVQIFPDDDTGGTDFPDASSFKWDYGFLAPATWVITATAAGRTQQVTLRMPAPPVINLTEPDARGGRDFARTVIGDAWDLTNPQDAFRWGGVLDLSNVVFGENGLSATTSGVDPHIQFLNDIGRSNAAFPLVDASVYRHFSYVYQAVRDDLTPEQMRFDGNVARIIWRHADNNPVNHLFTNSQDVVPLDGEPTLYAFDLPSLTKFGCDECGDCHLELPGPACSFNPPLGTDLWTQTIGALRFDPMEPEANQVRPFRLSDVRLAADDEPNGNGFFVVRWNATDAVYDAQPDVANAKVTLSWDLDRNPASGRTVIAADLAAAAGQYSWSVAGLAPGRYWIYAEIADTAGNSQARYSTGPVRITTAFPAATDANRDGIADAWASRYGVGDASVDTDGDGFTNLAEYQNATNPLIPQTWNLSEGATGFFSERIAIANPDTDTAEITVTFLRETGTPIVRDYTVAPLGRLTIPVNDVAGLSSASVSAIVTATRGGVIVERTMLWDARSGGLYGGHTGKGIPAARTSWLLAEGEQSFFDTYILFANAGATNAVVTVTFLLDGGSPVQRTYDVAASSRLTVYAGAIQELKGRAFSTAITSSAPITVERAMYFGSTAQRLWNGGHEAAAIPAPSTNWFVAEGRSGPFFDMYLLLANPNTAATTATIRYLLPGGSALTRTYALPAQSRFTVHVDSQEARLADTEVSAEISAPLPIVVERAMYWPDPFSNWYEAHSSAGVTTTGTLWAMAEGEVGGPLGWSTFVLLANPGTSPTTATLTFLRTNQPPIVITQAVPAGGRVTVDAGSVPGLASGERFGVLVDTGAGGVPIVVEHAIYFNGPGGQFFAGGMNETAVRIR